MVLSLLAQSSVCSITVESSVAGPCFKAFAAATICCRWKARRRLREWSSGVAHCHFLREGSSSLKVKRESDKIEKRILNPQTTQLQKWRGCINIMRVKPGFYRFYLQSVMIWSSISITRSSTSSSSLPAFTSSCTRCRFASWLCIHRDVCFHSAHTPRTQWITPHQSV